MLVLFAIAALFAGCSVPCESAASGRGRDECFYARVSADTQRWSAADIVRFAGQMEDPIVREATVMTWVREQRGQVAEGDRAQVCGLFRGGVERNACERRLATAHLLR